VQKCCERSVPSVTVMNTGGRDLAVRTCASHSCQSQWMTRSTLKLTHYPKSEPRFLWGVPPRRKFVVAQGATRQTDRRQFCAALLVDDVGQRDIDPDKGSLGPSPCRWNLLATPGSNVDSEDLHPRSLFRLHRADPWRRD